MNFLAHIFLSGSNKNIAIGNFMADSIRGSAYKNYPREFQIGILLHRYIDSFTDAPCVFRQSKKRLYEKYRHYSGVIIDIYYDHFLAKNWDHYSDSDLESFSDEFYQSLDTNYHILPQNIKSLLPYLVADNWLYNYRHLEGIQRVLNGMNNRAKYKSNMNLAIQELQEYYTEFENEFTDFFSDAIDFSELKLKDLREHL